MHPLRGDAIVHRDLIYVFDVSRPAANEKNLIQNQDFGSKKNSIWAELFFTDQIEGADFEFLGLEIRFERNREIEFLKFDCEFSKSILGLWYQKLDFKLEIRFRSQNLKIGHNLPLQFHTDFDQNLAIGGRITQNLPRISPFTRKFREFFFYL